MTWEILRVESMGRTEEINGKGVDVFSIGRRRAPPTVAEFAEIVCSLDHPVQFFHGRLPENRLGLSASAEGEPMATRSALPSSDPAIERDDGDAKASDASTEPEGVEALAGRRFGCLDAVGRGTRLGGVRGGRRRTFDGRDLRGDGEPLDDQKEADEQTASSDRVAMRHRVLEGESIRPSESASVGLIGCQMDSRQQGLG